MSEKPIIFSSGMVRAILEGRKTQTRRIIKPQPDSVALSEPYNFYLCCDKFIKHPYKVGDLLYVRETWGFDRAGGRRYKASYIPGMNDDPADGSDVPKWYPSIHMPKWAARIWLEVTAVRCEVLNTISEADAKAEGAAPYGVVPDYRSGFYRVWTDLYGEKSWAALPWVWVLEFRRVEK